MDKALLRFITFYRVTITTKSVSEGCHRAYRHVSIVLRFFPLIFLSQTHNWSLPFLCAVVLQKKIHLKLLTFGEEASRGN